MTSQEFETATQKMQDAITTPEGDFRPIDRIEFEVLGSQVRWTLWEDGRRLYVATTEASDAHGFLVASKMILKMRAGQCVHEDHQAHEGREV